MASYVLSHEVDMGPVNFSLRAREYRRAEGTSGATCAIFSGAQNRCDTNAAGNCEDASGDSVRAKKKVGCVRDGDFSEVAHALLFAVPKRRPKNVIGVREYRASCAIAVCEFSMHGSQ